MVEASSTPFYSELLIDGQLLAGEGAAEAIINPATGEVLTQVREASAEQVEAAILAAHRAFTDWSRTTPAQRAVALCWVMHLAGDVHQPLHTAQLFSSRYPNGDGAGGRQFVIDPVSKRPETLHWFWDDSIHRAGDMTSVLARTADLERRLPRVKVLPGAARARAADSTIDLTVAADGTVQQVSLNRAFPGEVAEKIQRTLSSWLFLPRINEGVPVPSHVQVPLRF